MLVIVLDSSIFLLSKTVIVVASFGSDTAPTVANDSAPCIFIWIGDVVGDWGRGYSSIWGVMAGHFFAFSFRTRWIWCQLYNRLAGRRKLLGSGRGRSEINLTMALSSKAESTFFCLTTTLKTFRGSRLKWKRNVNQCDIQKILKSYVS